MMKKCMLYIHGKGGSAAEAEHYRPLLPGYAVIGFDYHAETPWEAAEEFPAFYDAIAAKYDSVSVIANSLGACFALMTLGTRSLEQAFFISPVADMERLIRDMMVWARVTEDELREKGEIATAFGETLSWEYLTYVREHPVQWNTPSFVLYGEKDHLVSYDTIAAFSERIHAPLTVHPGGEHWFHTEEQLAFLDAWLLKYVNE